MQKGDLNRDDRITPADALIALQLAVGSRPCDPTTLVAADASGDGKVTSLDALMRVITGSIEVVSISPELFDRAVKLYSSHKDKEWGMTDYISFIVMRWGLSTCSPPMTIFDRLDSGRSRLNI